MESQKHFLLFILLMPISLAYGQNIQSLSTEKKINSTFSILAYDSNAEEWGNAVATNNIYVGNSTIYIEPKVGAFSVIADTEPMYGINGLDRLEAGKSIKQAIEEIRDNDDESNFRQVSGIDAEGNVYAFTGKSLKYWNGKAGQILGKNYVVMGNQLGDRVLAEMSKSFENSKGTLAERLLKSLIAGQNAGGQISGKQSSAIVVKGTNNEWYNQIDLRVDHSKQPLKELQTLMDYHYGRIRLNQARNAQRAGNLERAKQKLSEAETMLNGWIGMYSKIAIANVVMGNKIQAVNSIKKGLRENPNWVVNVPAFYFLRNNPEMKSIIQIDSFTTTDWESAMGMLSNLGLEEDLIKETKELFKNKIESSYLNFLLGRSYYYEEEQENAIKYLEQALKMDSENVETEKLLLKIKSK